jgi:hypothetical protein
MKMFSTLLLIAATIVSVSMEAQAGAVLTTDGRTSLSECHQWDATTLAEKNFLRTNAAQYAQNEMQTACLAQGSNLTPVVIDVTPRGYKCQSFAKVGLYLMTVSFTCEN